MTEETHDQRVAKSLGAHPDQVRAARDEWNVSMNAVFIRGIISDRITRQITERLTKLKTVHPDQLQIIQGELKALELSLHLACQHPLKHE